MESSKSAPAKARRRRRRPLTRLFAWLSDGFPLPWLVLVVCLGLTYALCRNAEQNARQELSADFNFRAREALGRIEQRILVYQQLLRGAQGLFNAKATLERDEFNRYVASLRLERAFPGVQAVGLALAVPAELKQHHLAAVRGQGFPAYDIAPAGKRDLYTPVMYIAPFADANLLAFGYDMYAEPLRRAAMEQARDTGGAAISGKLQLRTESEQSRSPGFLMYLPVYQRDAKLGSAAERRAHLVGWVFSAFRMEDLMRGLLGDATAQIDFEIYDGKHVSAATLMYDSDDSPGSRDRAGFQSISELDIAGHAWTVAIRSHDNFEAQLDTGRAQLIAATGVAASVMLAYIVWLLLNGRARALMLARKMNRDLIDSESRWHFALEGAGDGVWDWDVRGDTLFYSGGWKQMLGIKRDAVDATIGKWQERLHADDKAAVLSALHAHLWQGAAAFSAECRLRTADDGWLWVLVRGAVVARDADGQPLRMIGSNSDISLRKRADDELKLAAMVYRTSGEAMMVTDACNNLIAINPAFTRMTGYEAAEVLGCGLDFLDAGRADQAFLDAMWHALRTDDHWQGEVWKQRKSGEQFAVLWSINAIRHPDGAVYRYVALLTDITERKRSEEVIWKQANFDGLTGLPNRRLFLDRLAHEVRKAQRSGLLMAVFFIDLDRFKEVNDTLGHDSGDQLLIEAARRIAASVRASDTVARLGGDEFTVLLAELAAPNVEALARKILGRLAAPFQLGSEWVYLSASIGITLFPADASGPEELLKNADQAMYLSKEQGRNRFNYYTGAMQEAAQRKLRISADLRGALALGQLKVYFQPIIDAQSGRIAKAEALLRWFHPERGMVSPAEFIPVAEESSLINEIGDWVFKEAVDWTERWSRQLGQPFQISVNKSPAQFLAQANYTDWAAYLEQRDLPGACIAVEITEGLLLNTTPFVQRQLQHYRRAGIKVSIDDFGTGYSSMSYLKNFDIDYLKIDQSFVRDMVSDRGDRAIAEAIIVMAHKLGYRVIAEGVETAAQRDMLAGAGCDYFQGWLYSKAIPPQEFERMLMAQHPLVPQARAG